jgi:hypothetical protein
VANSRPEASIRLLATEDAVQSAFDNFLTASRAADVPDETLAIRTNEAAGSTVIIGPGQVMAPVSVSNAAAGLIDTTDDFVTAVNSEYEARWEEANPFTIDTPGLTTLIDALESHTSSELSEAFEAAITNADSLGSREDPLDVIILALLLGARYEAQLYDLSEWGEETGLASKATFSRKKSQLADIGVIDTESIPIDVGRPRLELQLAVDVLGAVAPADFVEQSRSVLSE